jgi:isocitrate dehydrogenase (NAD+)
MTYCVTLIPGDGVGPEITEATRRVLEATNVDFRWELAYVGATAQEKFGTLIPDSVLQSIKKNRVALKGPVTTPVGSGFRSVNVGLRKSLGLYACLRPAKAYLGAPSLRSDVDLVVVRENMEDLYSGIEFERGTPEAERLIELVRETKGEMLGEDSASR